MLQSITNSILLRSFRENVPVTPMKLQKLLYFVYRDYLHKTNEPLFNEQFATWQYGPVLPSVYEEFRSFHSSRITSFSKDAKGDVYVVDEGESSDVLDSLNRVWRKYRDYSGVELSQMTHENGTAWTKAFLAKRPYLDTEDIQNESA